VSSVLKVFIGYLLWESSLMLASWVLGPLKSDPVFLDISPANGGMSSNQGGRDEIEAPEGEAGEQ
jgi:hypothetical protein